MSAVGGKDKAAIAAPGGCNGKLKRNVSGITIAPGNGVIARGICDVPFDPVVFAFRYDPAAVARDRIVAGIINHQVGAIVDRDVGSAASAIQYKPGLRKNRAD